MKNINITLHFLHMRKQYNIKKLLIISSIILTAIYSCEDENLINPIDQRNLHSSNDYLLIQKTIIDIEREIEVSGEDPEASWLNLGDNSGFDPILPCACSNASLLTKAECEEGNFEWGCNFYTDNPKINNFHYKKLSSKLELFPILF